MSYITQLQTHFAENAVVSQRKLREFGLIVGGLFVFVALILNVSGHAAFLQLPLLLLGLALAGLGMVLPALLHYPYLGWMALGLTLGFVIAPIVLAIIYYLFFSPIAVIKNLFSSRPTFVRYDTSVSSYWQDRTEPYDSSQSETLY